MGRGGRSSPLPSPSPPRIPSTQLPHIVRHIPTRRFALLPKKLHIEAKPAYLFLQKAPPQPGPQNPLGEHFTLRCINVAGGATTD